jgi:hypothetical protein
MAKLEEQSQVWFAVYPVDTPIETIRLSVGSMDDRILAFKLSRAEALGLSNDLKEALRDTNSLRDEESSRG